MRNVVYIIFNTKRVRRFLRTIMTTGLIGIPFTPPYSSTFPPDLYLHGYVVLVDTVSGAPHDLGTVRMSIFCVEHSASRRHTYLSITPTMINSIWSECFEREA